MIDSVGNDFPKGTSIPQGDALVGNVPTQIHDGGGLWERPAMVAEVAFGHYESPLRVARLSHTDHAVFLTVVDSGQEPMRWMVLQPGESAVLGRHAKCDLQLEHDNIALRHLAVHVAQSSTGDRPLLRVWDLHTGNTLSTHEGHKVEALAADGPTFLSLGRYHIAAIPLGQLPGTLPADPQEAWKAIPEPRYVSSLGKGSGSKLLPFHFGGPTHTTSVTRLPNSVGLEELTVSPVDPMDAIATLQINGQRKTRCFDLGEEHLERGVLVGRYDRCLGRGFDPTVSRVHLLITSVDGVAVAIDTASTVGCQVDGAAVRSHILTGPTKISLGKYSHLLWRPLRGSEEE